MIWNETMQVKENVECEQFAVFVATTQLLVNYSCVKYSRIML